ncbi:hypothetical protein L596_005131 [Steinernema carpocapsae]|uniref:Uncharacterized protein n=1 Tax=Steinernema carpocapsae TaxID=34508 RepID=A0A4U8UZ28_STECR|nr:hypothetical protein L596_005131 [Steinernema carpocapsae]
MQTLLATTTPKNTSGDYSHPCLFVCRFVPVVHLCAESSRAYRHAAQRNQVPDPWRHGPGTANRRGERGVVLSTLGDHTQRQLIFAAVLRGIITQDTIST